MNARLYPFFVSLEGRECVVIGGNELAETKIRDLLDTKAKVRVIAPTVTDQIRVWADAGRVQWEARAYEAGDLRDAFLVVSVSDADSNAKVFQEAEMRRLFCNSVDDVEHCSSYAPAVVRRGALQIAISTAGQSPALAQRLRKELEEQFGVEYEMWLTRLGALRRSLFQDKDIDGESRRVVLHEEASATAFEAFRSSIEKASTLKAPPMTQVPDHFEAEVRGNGERAIPGALSCQ